MGTYYVYRHYTDDINKPFYIGMGYDRRYKACDRNARCYDWFEYVKENPTWVAVITDDNLSLEEARCIERKYILFYGRIDRGTGILINRNNGIGEPPIIGNPYDEKPKTKFRKK